jgi:lipopolysaccharide exporter
MATFFSNTLKLVSGNIIAQIIGIILIPLITRLYLPADFGIFQLFSSIFAIIVIFSCLSYQLAIMLPNEDEDSANIVALCCILITIISFISGCFFIIFSDTIGNILNAPALSQYLIFIPLVVFVNSLFNVLIVWLSRTKRFGDIAAAQVVNSISNKGVQIGFGIYAPSPIGLISGVIVGYSAAIGFRFRSIKNDLFLFRKVRWNNIRNLAIRYKNFPLFMLWSEVANTLSTQIVPLLLVFFFTPEIVGYYALANMVVFLPMGLIGNATAQVFFQKACEEKNRTGSITNIVREIQQRLISIGMFPMFVLIIIGEELFSFVLGSQWYIAGQYAGILAPWLLFVFIAAPLSTIFSVLEKQTVDLAFNILILISRFVVLVVGGIYGDPVTTLILFSLTGVLFWGGMNLYLVKLSGITYRVALFDYLKFFFLAFIVAMPLLAIKLLSMPLYILFITAGVVSFIYYLIVILNDSLLKNEVVRALQGFRLGK